MERIKNGLLVFDGAMGTQLQKADIPEKLWLGKNGCNEVLNLSAADLIKSIHSAYFQAGADIVETNTFGANEEVLKEYGLEDRLEEINIKACEAAREAAAEFSSPERPRYIAGSIGPGTKLPSLLHTDYQTLFNSYKKQAAALLKGKADAFLIETCQDLLQIKAAVNACKSANKEAGTEVPVFVSLTIETSGRLLIGSSLEACAVSLAGMGIAVLGINCATGPDMMERYIRTLCSIFPGPVICQPNAGLPKNIGGKTVYTADPAEFASALASFIDKYGLNIAGGCCGTGPAFIAEIDKKCRTVKPAERKPVLPAAVSSLFSIRMLGQKPSPFFIGERLNASGSRQFRQALLDSDSDGILEIARQQEALGAHGLDVNTAWPGTDEKELIKETVSRLNLNIDLPLFIDSTNPEVIEEALKNCAGRAGVNSINLEDGTEKAEKIISLAKKYGAALIALTIDRNGMAKTLERKLEICGELYRLAVTKHGLDASSLIIDPLTFTLASGDAELENAGKATLESLSEIKKRWPGVFTVLGVSNISYGLAENTRKILNSVFLSEAVKHGLDMAIFNVQKLVPLASIPEAAVKACLGLIYNEKPGKSLFEFLEYFSSSGENLTQESSSVSMNDEEKLADNLIKGRAAELAELINRLTLKMPAAEIISLILVPAMKKVGSLFQEGKLQLPFVLKAAEIMKAAVQLLEKHMEQKTAGRRKCLVIATVKADVHDIGKNLVDIILSNNGYKVVNLGTKCDVDTVIAAVKEHSADAAGLSGLLVKSTEYMKEYLEEFEKHGIKIPVLLGGAALNAAFVEEYCRPVYSGKVIYCADAFDGLKAMESL
jgi:5-methyltetrahydrofolate--homocysteine methyltransferase